MTEKTKGLELYPVYCRKCATYLCDLPEGAGIRCPVCNHWTEVGTTLQRAGKNIKGRTRKGD